jgi:hypothetical protein
MKFIFADSLDYVDPDFDFIGDRSASDRQPYWDDVYPHQLMDRAPYDGVLVSRAILGGHRVKGKYTPAQARRFETIGARKFLRLDTPELSHLPIFGDCGAFAYANEDTPPYTPAEIAEFYDDCGFTHGCSVDHIIFDFDPSDPPEAAVDDRIRHRFGITLDNAERFLREVRSTGANFTPLGAVQGWSPGSMALAARQLVSMGYDYLALGGMVPLKAFEIAQCVHAIREAVPSSIRLHILGFAKAEHVDAFRPLNVTSFDSTSPLIRAFKDGKQNYYLPGDGTGLRYYTAIRVPQSIENPRLQRVVKKGMFRAEDLTRLEGRALEALRAYDKGMADLEDALNAAMTYGAVLLTEQPYEDCAEAPPVVQLEHRYRTTLSEKPWKECGCAVCRETSIEVVIFRGSNRNKRRGMHNLSVYKNHLERLENLSAA